MRGQKKKKHQNFAFVCSCCTIIDTDTIATDVQQL